MMRVTIHVASAADYWPMTAAIRRSRREWFERVGRREVGSLDTDSVAAAVREELADGPLKHGRADADEWSPAASRRRPARLGRNLGRSRARPAVRHVGEAARRPVRAGRAMAAAPHATSRRLKDSSCSCERYLGAFGPARPTEIADWAGVPVARAGRRSSPSPLRRFVDESGRELVDLPDAPLPDEGVAAPVRFLPTWDATLLVHARRTQILPEKYRATCLQHAHAAFGRHIPRRRTGGGHVAIRQEAGVPTVRGTAKLSDEAGRTRGRATERLHALTSIARARARRATPRAGPSRGTFGAAVAVVLVAAVLLLPKWGPSAARC